MPKKLSDAEKEYIIKRLKEEATTCLTLYGIRKTTVDELVRRVGIPKGTFYLFYESKELLFFDVMNDLNKEMHEYIMQEILVLQKGITVDTLTDFLYSMYKKVNDTGLINILIGNEMEFLIRKLPPEKVKEHLLEDDTYMEQLFSSLPFHGNQNIEAFSAAFRGIFLTVLYQREMGEEVYDAALKLMIRGLVLQILEEDMND